MKTNKEEKRHISRFERSKEEIAADKKVRDEIYLGYFDMDNLALQQHLHKKEY